MGHFDDSAHSLHKNLRIGSSQVYFCFIRIRSDLFCIPLYGWGLLALIHMLLISPAQLISLYESWWKLLSTDYNGSAGNFSDGVAEQLVSILIRRKILVNVHRYHCFLHPAYFHQTVRSIYFPWAFFLQHINLGNHLQSQGRVRYVYYRSLWSSVVVFFPGKINYFNLILLMLDIVVYVPLSHRFVSPGCANKFLCSVHCESCSLHLSLGENHLRVDHSFVQTKSGIVVISTAKKIIPFLLQFFAENIL